MPANRTEAPAEDAAETPQAAGNAAASSGGIKAWLPLIVMVVLMPALAFAMTNFVLVPKLQKGLGGSTAGAAGAAEAPAGKGDKKGPAAKKETIPMTKLLVNVAGTMGARYLLCSLSVVGSSADFK